MFSVLETEEIQHPQKTHSLQPQFPLCLFRSGTELCDLEIREWQVILPKEQYRPRWSIPNCIDPRENTSQVILGQSQSNNKEEKAYQE